jgi:cytochrome c peroxidase
MKNKVLIALILSLILVLTSTITVLAKQEPEPTTLTPIEELGKEIFNDSSLSINQNQSCASCHAPEVGWTGPTSLVNDGGAVYEGSILGRFGDRKPPSAAYATQSPIFFMDKKGLFIGGNFWDGRATGEVLGNPAADQALGPFLNTVEQALPDSACVVYRVTNGAYSALFFEVWGVEASTIIWPESSVMETICSTEGATVPLSPGDRAKSDTAYGQVGLSIAAYEASFEVNAFTSKYDLAKSGKVKLTKEEQKGLALFKGKGKCSKCHTISGQNPLFTDYTFDNLGIPKNTENPVYDINPSFIDPGLGGFLENAGYPADVYEAEWGKHKVPTLRNVDLRPYEGFVKAYGHNGYFKSLEEIVHFYNTRDVEGAGWPAPEVPENVNTAELGDLGLTLEEEAAIVAFLKTLSDGYVPD